MARPARRSAALRKAEATADEAVPFVGNRAGLSTKQSIMDAAERLFAQESFASVSMRSITQAAKVSLAAVNYHFGSKDALLRAVFERRAKELNRERLRLLREEEEACAPLPIPLSRVLHALLAPGVRWAFDPVGQRALFVQFLARAHNDGHPSLKQMFYRNTEHLRRFVPHLQKAAPGIGQEDLFWCLHFALGAMHYTITDLGRLEAMADGAVDITQAEKAIERIVSFTAAGFAAAGK